MHADGNGIDSAGTTLFLICRAIVYLFVFLRVPSQLDNAQGDGPKVCFKTSLIIQITTYSNHFQTISYLLLE